MLATAERIWIISRESPPFSFPYPTEPLDYYCVDYFQDGSSSTSGRGPREEIERPALGRLSGVLIKTIEVSSSFLSAFGYQHQASESECRCKTQNRKSNEQLISDF
jgi:hypothetical protein